MTTTPSTSEKAFREIYKDLATNGKLCAPRGQKVIELEHYTYKLPAYVRYPSFEARNFKPDYTKREFLWYLRANPHDTSITRHAKIWQDLITPEGNINSNYGQYVFNRGVQKISPFERVILELKADPDSRRASITILGSPTYSTHFSYTNAPNQYDDNPGTVKDMPCTYSMNFRIRDGKLNMSVHMRSQDAIFGMGNDAPCFSFIHEMVFIACRDLGLAAELGDYFHTADSFHVYERHFKMLEAIVTGSPYIEIPTPKITNTDEVRHLIHAMHTRYKGGRSSVYHESAIREKLMASRKMAFEAPSPEPELNFPFANWLLEPELADDALSVADWEIAYPNTTYPY